MNYTEPKGIGVFRSKKIKNRKINSIHAVYSETKNHKMQSIEGKQVPEGTMVWVAGFEGKDRFWKPIPKRLNYNYRNFYANFQVCVDYCKLLNAKK